MAKFYTDILFQLEINIVNQDIFLFQIMIEAIYLCIARKSKNFGVGDVNNKDEEEVFAKYLYILHAFNVVQVDISLIEEIDEVFDNDEHDDSGGGY